MRRTRAVVIRGSLHTREALFGVGGAALLLLFIGIHNAWDSVASHVFPTSRIQTLSGAHRLYGRGHPVVAIFTDRGTAVYQEQPCPNRTA